MDSEKLRSHMKELGLTSTELANKLGVSRSWVYMWLNGSRQIPNWVSLCIYALSIGVTDEKLP